MVAMTPPNTVEVKLEQRRRIIRRPAGVGAASLGKAQRVEIERTDKGVEEAHRVFGADVILQPFGKQQRLRAVQSSPMVHACQRRHPGVEVSTMSDFSHSLALEPAVALYAAQRHAGVDANWPLSTEEQAALA